MVRDQILAPLAMPFFKLGKVSITPHLMAPLFYPYLRDLTYDQWNSFLHSYAPRIGTDRTLTHIQTLATLLTL